MVPLQGFPHQMHSSDFWDIYYNCIFITNIMSLWFHPFVHSLPQLTCTVSLSLPLKTSTKNFNKYKKKLPKDAGV